MKDEDFEKTMDNWAAHEVESAPQLRPTEEMYRMIPRTRRSKKGFFPVHAQRILVVVSVACMVLFGIILPIALRLSEREGQPSIGLRRTLVPKMGIIVKPPPRRGGPKKGAISFHQLMFHYYKADSQSVYGIDIRFPREEKITLTADDNYRLAMQPAGERYVYIYQLDSRGQLVKLVPNNAYSSVQNPLQQEQTYYVPSGPNWFHPGKEEGEEQIYVVVSTQPIPKLNELYIQYDKADSRSKRQEFLSHLLKELDGELSSRDIAVWRFVFGHQ